MAALSEAFQSLRFRLTLWYGLVLLVALGAFAFLVYGVVRFQLHHHHDGSLVQTAEAVKAIVRRHDDCEHLSPEQVADLDGIGKIVLLHDVGGEGRVFYRSKDAVAAALPFELAVEADVLTRPAWFETVRTDTGLVRAYSSPYQSHAGRNGVIRVIERLGDVDVPLRGLRTALLVMLPGALLVASVGGYFLARRALAPVDHVTRLAREIEASNLSLRLPAPAARDEVGRLVDTLNQMIGRLETSFEGMKRFTADASHELRSPLATMRTSIDVALSRPRTAEEYRAVMLSVGEEVDRLRAIVADLLVLARADAGRVVFERARVRLDTLASEVVESVQPAALPRGVQLETSLDGEAVVVGDERWLRQLLVNLLENAIEFSASSAGCPTHAPRVRVAVKRRDGTVVLTVADTGPGIPHDALPHVFERFYRADEARASAPGGGVGLGLAIAAWIVEAHGGRIAAANLPGGGSELTVELPEA